MLHLRFTFLLLLLAGSTAFAQTGNIIDWGGGISTFNDSSGRSGTIVDLGGGIKSYNDNHGVSGNIIDLGNGIQSYNFTSPMPPAAPFGSGSAPFAAPGLRPTVPMQPMQPMQPYGFGR